MSKATNKFSPEAADVSSVLCWIMRQDTRRDGF
ncbi:hypothetical protein QBD01_001401 [Ochrobactrum sp. 19YEA23]|nr:hypothetical protein [Ochrobactrum sp. 19YEA23]